MDRKKFELMPDIEQQMDKLMGSLLDLIDHYNGEETHRKISPISNFGELSGEARLFWANWGDDQRSTHLLGFTYEKKTGELLDVVSRNIISLEEVQKYFLQQLKDIPLKS